MLVGLVGPCILEDLTHILEGFLVPLLSYEPQPIISADVEQAAAAPAIAGKPASPECMKLKGKLGSSSSTDSHPPDTESVFRQPPNCTAHYASSNKGQNRHKWSVFLQLSLCN